MGILTADTKRLVSEQQLGFIATVCSDGTPNLSPKGTTPVWDDDHLIFADVCSPNTIANLRRNPALEINVVDTLLRKGYRFKGVATVVNEGPQFDQMINFYRKRGSTTVKHHLVLMKIDHAASFISPVYDNRQTETQRARALAAILGQLWNRRGNARSE